jgi:hypothetical protein
MSTPEISNKVIITFESLKNILRILSSELMDTYEVYVSKETEYRKIVKQIEREGDRTEYDNIWEKIKLNEENYDKALLLNDLYEAIDTNPFPGQQLPVLTIAVALFPNIKLSGFTGRAAWEQLFREQTDTHLKLNACDLAYARIRFPINTNTDTIEQIEEQLYELARGSDTVPATELARILNTNTGSKQYRVMKQLLTTRGWSWGQKRIDGIMCKIIRTPTNAT